MALGMARGYLQSISLICGQTESQNRLTLISYLHSQLDSHQRLSVEIIGVVLFQLHHKPLVSCEVSLDHFLIIQ